MLKAPSVPAYFYVRVRKHLLDYKAELDEDSTLIQMYIRDSGIPPGKLAQSLNISEQDVINFATGSGRKPSVDQRSTMKYVITNYLGGMINAK